MSIQKGQIHKMHKRYNCRLLDGTIEDCKELAEIMAKDGNDGLLRFFAYREDGSAHFYTAFSILGGKVTEHKDVTIPAAHW